MREMTVQHAANLQAKIDKQRDEIRRLTVKLEAVQNDLSDIKDQRDKFRREVQHLVDHFKANAKNTLIMLQDMGKL